MVTGKFFPCQNSRAICGYRRLGVAAERVICHLSVHNPLGEADGEVMRRIFRVPGENLIARAQELLPQVVRDNAQLFELLD
jgi:hypothetical protein